MPVTITVTGLEQATSFLKLLGDAAKEVGRTHFRISSDLPYPFWIEEGYYASGRPGRRRAGGAHMVRRGIEALEQRAPDVVARTLEDGPQQTRNALAGLAGYATTVVKGATPVVSGNLRASFHSTTLGRGG